MIGFGFMDNVVMITVSFFPKNPSSTVLRGNLLTFWKPQIFASLQLEERRKHCFHVFYLTCDTGQMGELIDNSLGVMFGLSTLTAAGIGQIFSDVSGVCSHIMRMNMQAKHLCHAITLL